MESLHGWLTLNNRHTGERPQMRRFDGVATPVMVGTPLGRYKGTDWPGCPDRCQAAPLQ